MSRINSTRSGCKDTLNHLLDVAAKRLQPKSIIIYGTTLEKDFRKYIDIGIDIWQFDSCYAATHKEVV